MTRRIPIIHYALIALLAMPTAAFSTEKELIHDWAAVMAVQPGVKLFIKLKDGKKVKGMLNSTYEKMLFLSHNNQIEGIERQDILEIRLDSGRSRKELILTMTASGAVGGVIVGAASGALVAASERDSSFDSKKIKTIGIGTAVGAIAGTVLGFFMGLFRNQGDLIYRAPQ